jgi:hypothetical protein
MLAKGSDKGGAKLTAKQRSILKNLSLPLGKMATTFGAEAHDSGVRPDGSVASIMLTAMEAPPQLWHTDLEKPNGSLVALLPLRGTASLLVVSGSHEAEPGQKVTTEVREILVEEDMALRLCDTTVHAGTGGPTEAEAAALPCLRSDCGKKFFTPRVHIYLPGKAASEDPSILEDKTFFVPRKVIEGLIGTPQEAARQALGQDQTVAGRQSRDQRLVELRKLNPTMDRILLGVETSALLFDEPDHVRLAFADMLEQIAVAGRAMDVERSTDIHMSPLNPPLLDEKMKAAIRSTLQTSGPHRGTTLENVKKANGSADVLEDDIQYQRRVAGKVLYKAMHVLYGKDIDRDGKEIGRQRLLAQSRL